MDLLITVIGNAVVDPAFRTRLLDNPVKALDDWRFRLTNSEIGMLEEMFTNLSPEQNKELKDKFESLGTTLYQNRDGAMKRNVLLACPTRRCTASVYPCLPELRADLKKTALAESKTAAA
jgi:hypothetical protein